MIFLFVIFLIAAATAAPTVGNVEDQKTNDSTPPAAATIAPPGGNNNEDLSTKSSTPPAETTTTHSDGNNEDQSTTQKSQPPQAAAENSHPEHTEAGKNKVEGHEEKMEEVKEKAKEEAVKEEAKEHVKKEEKKESMGEIKKEAKEEVKGEVKEEVKAESKEADKDDTDWEKRELKYKMDGQPVCAAKIEYKSTLSHGGNGYESVKEMEKIVSECEVGVDILTERGNELGTMYAASILLCGETCQLENSDRTHPLVGRPEGGQKKLRSSLVKTEEQEQKIQKFWKGITETVKAGLVDYNKKRMDEVYNYNNNLVILKALKIVKLRKENEAALKRALAKRMKEQEAKKKKVEEVLAKQKKAAELEAARTTVEAEKQSASAPEQSASADTKKPDVQGNQIEGEAQKHEKTTVTESHSLT